MATQSQIQELIRQIRPNIQDILNKDSSESAVELAIKHFINAPWIDISLSSEEIDNVIKEIKSLEGITMDIGSMVTGEDELFKEWLPTRKEKDDPTPYWDDYNRELKRTGYSSSVLYSIDIATDRILSKCSDPLHPRRTKRQGMVVGSVQSGKTANYIGLLTKAADYGYKVIIVIAGIHESLREQTQFRINEGFIGLDTSFILTDGVQKRGVGKFLDQDNAENRPQQFTSEKYDFNSNRLRGQQIINNSQEKPVVFVIKKQKSILENLFTWLTSSAQTLGVETLSLPALVIDDEADNASINIAYSKKDSSSISTINKYIRKITNCFDVSTYIGYTATPFANIFIDPSSDDAVAKQDLFPKDFIVGLEPPSNYVSPQRIFLEEGDLSSSLVDLDDNEEYIPLKHKKDLDPLLPPSLLDAINCYIVSDAIKNLRGIWDKRSSSMLVNVTYFKQVHARLRFLIDHEVSSIKNSIRACCGVDSANDDKRIRALKSCFDQYYQDSEHKWVDVRNSLLDIHKRLRVAVINSSSVDTLKTSPGQKEVPTSTIAIGGFSLSRGLTLEGLTISYFLRGSMMYDTLLQMGRWFGYRTKYEDLCRIWMTPLAQDFYAQITIADTELRQELVNLERSRSTPLDFGLKVRSHPDNLKITARNKFGSSSKQKKICLSDKFLETIDIKNDSNVIQQNLDSVSRLICYIQKSHSRFQKITGEPGNGYLAKSVDVNLVAKFIKEFQSMSLATRDIRPIEEYIAKRKEGEMREWDVFIPSVERNLRDKAFQVSGLEVGAQERTCYLHEKYEFPCIALSQRGKVAGRGVERVGLTANEIENCIDIWEEQSITSNSSQTVLDRSKVPDSIFRIQGRNPLLVVHILNIKEVKSKIKLLDQPKIPETAVPTAWSLSFPKSNLDDENVEYQVNSTWMRALEEIDRLEAEGIEDDL